jgi:UDP-2,3-diacylglucosamine pyrophosphatase LpxH
MGAAKRENHLTAVDEPHMVRYRALFISDLHLGTRAAQADSFLDFLRHHDAPIIYLVGDIIDFWRVKRGPIWLQSHNDVLQKLLRKVRKGSHIVYIPGNHDEAMRDYCGMHFGGIEIRRDVVHRAADGRRYLVMHGDEFDVVVRYAKWLAFLGDRSYEFALWCNTPLNWLRRKFGFGYWSLSAYLKLRVKSAVNFIGAFEHALAEEAVRRDVDGVICGHIHHAADRLIDGVRYLNCGDWVESCTALAEDMNGRIHLIRWHDSIVTRPVLTLRPVAPAPALAALDDFGLDADDAQAALPVERARKHDATHEGRLD